MASAISLTRQDLLFPAILPIFAKLILQDVKDVRQELDVAVVRNFVNGIIEELCDILIRAEGAVRSTLLVALVAQSTSYDVVDAIQCDKIWDGMLRTRNRFLL